MKPGNKMLRGFGDVESPITPTGPPYQQPYTPPYQYTETQYTAPYEEGMIPSERPALPPQLPMSETRYQTPSMPGPRYIQGTQGQIIPATHAPYPLPRKISDQKMIRILVTKNTYLVLKSKGLPTVCMRRRQLDPDTKRQILEEIRQRTLADLDAVARGEITKLAAGQDWQYEAIKYKLADAAELKNLMARVVPIESWLLKMDRPSKGV